MDGQRGRPILNAAFGVVTLFVAGCGNDAGGAASASPGHGAASVHQVDAAAQSLHGVPTGSGSGPSAAAHPTSPPGLAPAGPAPGGGGAGEADEESDVGAVSHIADLIGCEDRESQQHLPMVSQQLSCRRGIERVYVMAFDSFTNRDAYLASGAQVVTGGYNVVGPTWVVHVESQQTANELQQQRGGAVQPGA
jgi:hypothetical protein